VQPADHLISSRFRTALDLFAAGEELMRLKLARDNPELSADTVEALLNEWLRQRPRSERGRGAAASRPVP
jgi:hypothetical protein